MIENILTAIFGLLLFLMDILFKVGSYIVKWVFYFVGGVLVGIGVFMLYCIKKLCVRIVLVMSWIFEKGETIINAICVKLSKRSVPISPDSSCSLETEVQNVDQQPQDKSSKIKKLIKKKKLTVKHSIFDD